jgi:hypothetical protein
MKTTYDPKLIHRDIFDEIIGIGNFDPERVRKALGDSAGDEFDKLLSEGRELVDENAIKFCAKAIAATKNIERRDSAKT